MSAHSYILYVTIFYFLKMMLTYHISHEKIFSTALYVPGRSGVNQVHQTRQNSGGVAEALPRFNKGEIARWPKSWPFSDHNTHIV